jgi:hypothetical protein
MSPKNSLLIASLTALGLSGSALLLLGAADPAAPAPSGRSAPGPSRAVLLLTNGHIKEGLVSESGSLYYLHVKGGKIPYPKTSVEKVGHSLGEIYEYKKSLVPERDPDEHMKLALWCLTHGLRAEAKAQLEDVLELSPRNPRAIQMLDKIGGYEDRLAMRDPAVHPAGAEVVDDGPETLNPAIVERGFRALGISGLPKIPGLPTALAVKRAGEFNQLVDPIVQFHCARCHNEEYPGSFRLVRYRSKRDKTPEARHANLDAVLALVDMENPIKSELLSSTLRPHGRGSNVRPIFRGSNDPSYQILAAWVNSLRPPQAQAAAAQARGSRFGAAEPSSTEGFAVQRAQVPLPLSPTPAAAPIPSPGLVPIPGQAGPEASYEAAPPPEAAGATFPAPYMVGGPKPKLAGATASAAAPTAVPAQMPVPGKPVGGVPAQMPVPGKPVGVVPAAAGQAAAAPTAPTVAVPGAAAAAPRDPAVAGAAGTAAPKAAPSRKTFKLDPALLERALMNRNAPR